MKQLSNDVLIRIITTISEDKNKEISDLQDKITKLKDDLDNEKLKISNIKYITNFNSNYFCCDYCCNIFTWISKSPLNEVIEPYICIYCQNNPTYTQDILHKSIVYVVENCLCYYPTYDTIPKRYIHNLNFVINKYYYSDVESIVEDITSAKRSYEQAEKETIKQGTRVYLDYRNNINFENDVKEQRNIILKKI